MEPRKRIDFFSSALPLEIVEEILVRANVRSLLRFRCVSKDWRSLISKEKFIASHLQFSTKTTTISDVTLISYYEKLKASEIDDLLRSSVYDIFAGDEDQNVAVAGYCSYSNGLCCLFDESVFRLWNPSKREHYTLPSYFTTNRHARTSIEMYGFGHDKVSRDYKVFAVLLCVKWDEMKDVVKTHFEAKIYSLTNDSWKEVENFLEPNNSPVHECGKLVGSKLHWCFINEEDIICFDLSTMEHGFVELPVIPDVTLLSSVDVLKECLCVLAFCSQQKCCFDVWIMRDYGVKESWYKAITLPHDEESPHNFLKEDCHLWCVTQDLEILCSIGNWEESDEPEFEFYNPQTDTYRRPRIGNGNGNGLSRDKNLQSLVSPVPKSK